MSSFFVADTGVSRKVESNRVDPVLHRSRGIPRLTILLDLYPTQWQLQRIIQSLIETGSIISQDQVEILYCYTVKPITKAERGNVTKWTLKYGIDLKKYLTPGRNVLALGRAFYVFTKNVDVNINAFIDHVFNETHLKYHPLELNVFPSFGSFAGVYGKSEDDAQYGLLSILDNFQGFYFRQQIKRALTMKYDRVRDRYGKPIIHEIRENVNQWFLDRVGPGEIAIDTETSGFDFQRHRVGDLTISPDGINGYHFNWEDVDPEALSAYLKDKKLYVANGKFDGRFLRRYGVKNFVIAFDTRIVGHFLNERRSNSLKTHAWLYTIHGGYDEPLEQYKRENPKVKSYLQIPKSLRIPYATMDTIVDFQVAKAMQRELLADKDYQFQNGVQGPNLHDYHEKYVVPAINLFLDLEFKGLPIDWDKVKSVGELMDKEIAKSLESVQKAFGRTDIQYKGHELAKFIEYDLKWEEIARSEPTNRVHFDEATQKWVPVFKGWYLTNKNSFSEWERLGHPEAKLLGNLASWTAMKNTFIGDESEDEEDQLEKYREKIDEMGFFNASETDTKVEKVTKDSGLWKYRGTDDRIHATFMSFLALSHRHRTQGPNLQNIPKKDRDAAKLIRQVYKTANDDEFYDAEIDYMGFQLRIACAQSDEPNMRKAFAEIPGGDLHSVTAQMIFSPKETIFEFLSKKKEKKYKNWRDKSKTTNFALLFGTSARTFMENVLIKEWTLDDALEFVRDNNLSERVLILMSKGETKRKANFLACAEKIRKIFFEDLYPGLADWHETCKNIGRTQFYIRSPFGARRLLPELEYPDGRDQDGSVIKNMENIAINSPVQNHEVIPMTWCMVKLDDFIKKHNLKSEVVLTVHDSIRIFIHRSELKVISKFILDCMAYDWPEHKDVPVCGELNLAKPWEKEIWGFGKQEITLGNVEKVCDIMEELAPQVDIPFDIAA